VVFQGLSEEEGLHSVFRSLSGVVHVVQTAVSELGAAVLLQRVEHLEEAGSVSYSHRMKCTKEY
jgi:hypothetical protein